MEKLPKYWKVRDCEEVTLYPHKKWQCNAKVFVENM